MFKKFSRQDCTLPGQYNATQTMAVEYILINLNLTNIENIKDKSEQSAKNKFYQFVVSNFMDKTYIDQEQALYFKLENEYYNADSKELSDKVKELYELEQNNIQEKPQNKFDSFMLKCFPDEEKSLREDYNLQTKIKQNNFYSFVLCHSNEDLSSKLIEEYDIYCAGLNSNLCSE